MTDKDTIKLLKECDAGTKMAVTSIDDILDQIQADGLKSILSESKIKHEALGGTLHQCLKHLGECDKEPTGMAKAMSSMKTDFKLAMERGDSTIADLITDGCDMGIKSLYRYKNQYAQADSNSVNLCENIIKLEEQLRDELRVYL